MQEKLNRIIDLSLIYFGLTKHELTKSRKPELVRKRNFIMCVAGLYYDIDYKLIANAINLKSHASCIHAIRTVEKETEEQQVAEKFKSYRVFIKNNL